MTKELTLDRLSPVHDNLGTRNDLYVRLARTREEIVTAQRLRYRVFYAIT
jgi:putative hemolysin